MAQSREQKETEPLDIDVPSLSDILDDVLIAASANAATTEAFVESFEFYGKTLRAWSDELAVPIPAGKNLAPDDMRELYVKLANNIQIASHFLSMAGSINKAITDGSGLKKSDVVTAIIESYRKRKATRPAMAGIERMADSYMSNTAGTKIAAHIVKDFWRQRLECLIEVRKILEQVGMMTMVELKYMADT